MIERLHLLRNIGQFDSVAAANIQLARYTLVYAENGRGKTTLTAILRSLATGDPLPITERRRLASQHPPHVVLECSGGPPHAMFQDGAWNRTLSNILIFDDKFIDDNVHSGLAIESEHRQNLHELILGAQGVALNTELQEAVDQIVQDNANIRTAGDAIPVAERFGLSLDQFSSLQPVANVDEEIARAEQSVRATRQSAAIQSAALFPEIVVPPIIDSVAINEVLSRDLDLIDARAIERVRRHCDALGERGEDWISTGMQMLPTNLEEADCPFCEQPLRSSPRIDDFRAYFSEEYARLKLAISGAISHVEVAHEGERSAGFERSVRAAQDIQRFWNEFTTIEPITIDSVRITQDRTAARDAVLNALNGKRAAPLEPAALSAGALELVESFNADVAQIVQLNRNLATANQAVLEVKRTAAAANIAVIEDGLNRLRAARARHLAPTARHCERYLEAKAAKLRTEERRERAKESLRNYRANVFPQYETSVNRYLQLFNAGFRIGRVTPRDSGGGPTCTYGVMIGAETVQIAGGTARAGEPSFRSTLSSGDRNTLALAFFFASLDQDPALATKTVIIDDPVSSLDEHRSLTTVQQVRRLGERVGQLVVLSHNKSFLCDLYDGLDPALCSALSITRSNDGSTLVIWDVNADRVTEHDRRHELLLQFASNGPANLNNREVAQAIRPHIEAFLRVAHPEAFPPGALLGPFRNVCEQRVGHPSQILSQQKIDELRDLTEYSNLFHHDTNPAWATTAINDAQLRGFIGRLFAFIQN